MYSQTLGNTKEVIKYGQSGETGNIRYRRRNKAKQNTKYMQEEYEDTKGVISTRKSKKNRQHKGKKTNDDLQNTT